MNLVEKVKGFGNYEDNWDGDGSLAPSRDTIETALKLANCLKSPSLCFVGNSGNVIFEFHGKKEIKIIEICEENIEIKIV
jgi:hypothetical protein